MIRLLVIITCGFAIAVAHKLLVAIPHPVTDTLHITEYAPGVKP